MLELYNAYLHAHSTCTGYPKEQRVVSSFADRKQKVLHSQMAMHKDSFFFFFFCFLWPHLWHKEVPKLRGWNENEAAVAELCHNHSNPVSKPHLPSMATACSKAGSLTQWVRPGVEPTSSETLCWVLNLLNRNRNSMHNDSLLTIHRVNTWCSIQTLL